MRALRGAPADGGAGEAAAALPRLGVALIDKQGQRVLRRDDAHARFLRQKPL